MLFVRSELVSLLVSVAESLLTNSALLAIYLRGVLSSLEAEERMRWRAEHHCQVAVEVAEEGVLRRMVRFDLGGPALEADACVVQAPTSLVAERRDILRNQTVRARCFQKRGDERVQLL